MNVYSVTTNNPDHWASQSYIAANCLVDVFKHTNEDWQQSVTTVELVLQDLTLHEVMAHPWPISIAS